MSVTVADVREARERIRETNIVRQTPVERNRSLSTRLDASILLKMEHLQRTGSFKPRGAYNKLRTLQGSEDVNRIIAASAGNHAQGVALAAAKTGFEATIVMPKSAPQAKIDATRGYGATVELHGQDFQAAQSYAKSLDTAGSAFVHAYDDPDIVAGQGTIGLEIHEQVADLDAVVVPIGGGGLVSGVGACIGELAPSVRVVGVQAEGGATVADSLQKGGPSDRDSVQTIADGIATGGISDLTYRLIEKYVDEIITVTDTEIANAIVYLLERTKQMIEGAGAAPVAALLSDRVECEGQTVVPILSGGNLSMTDLQTILDHGLSYRGQLVRIQVQIVDRPGKMSDLSEVVAEHGGNIKSVQHQRAVADLDVGEAYLEFTVETSGDEQTGRIVDSIQATGNNVQILE